MAKISEVLKIIADNDVKYVDFRFTDLRGKWQHTTQHVSTVTDDMFQNGIMFDGSSISGWKEIHESDMTLMPDPTVNFLDPFSAQPMLVVNCDVLEPSTGQPYNRDPRSTARRAESYLTSSGIGDTAFFGPEAEFFVFDDARYSLSSQGAYVQLDSEEGPYNSGRSYEGGNRGHRPQTKGGYFPVPPIDSGNDLRAEMVSVLTEMGLSMEKHHHEVAPSQHELGLKYANLLHSADELQVYKYGVQMVADSYAKTATFMPKPIMDDNGSGMHCHQSIWKDGKNLFAGSLYSDLSEICLHYIGGIIKHARAINAFTNPTTNSYKRLVPGFEAPVLLAYSARNRSASCRIPYSSNPEGKRVEVRFPDPSSNPYLAFSAMLMAGLDGIENRIHPGDAMDKDLYDLPPEELTDIPTVCGSLRQALQALDQDRNFLKKGDVMSDDLIDAFITLKQQEVLRYETTPHPVEFDMYYSV